jgi:hypothetical protein
MELASVWFKVLPFTFFDYFREFSRLAILRDSLRIPRQTLVVFALVTLDCFSFFGHFLSFPDKSLPTIQLLNCMNRLLRNLNHPIHCRG